jgi:hypothetical protein
VTTDYALFTNPGGGNTGSKLWLRVLTYATNPKAVMSGGGSSSFNSVVSGSMGFGAGLGLGLLLASALAAFPAPRSDRGDRPARP